MVDETVVTLGDNTRFEVRVDLVSAELATSKVALLGGAGVSVENRAGRVEITEIGAVTSVTAPDRAPSPPVRLTPEQLEAAAGTVSW